MERGGDPCASRCAGGGRGCAKRVERHRAKKRWQTGTVVSRGWALKRSLPTARLLGYAFHTEFGDQEQFKLYHRQWRDHRVGLERKCDGAGVAGENCFRGDAGTANLYLGRDRGRIPTHGPTRTWRSAIERKPKRRSMSRYGRATAFPSPTVHCRVDVYEGVVEAARRNHIRLVGHVPWIVGMQARLMPVQDAIAHVEELYRYFVDRHKNLHPTPNPIRRRSEPWPGMQGAPHLGDYHAFGEHRYSSTGDRYCRRCCFTEMKFVPNSTWTIAVPVGILMLIGEGLDFQNQIMVPFLFKIVAGLGSRECP